MRSFVALLIALLSTSTSTLAVFTVPLTKFQRTGTCLKGSPDADRARAAFLKNRFSGPTRSTAPATNLGYVQYTTSVGIGNPPTYYNLVIDTGSSNTFCATGKPYVRTSTSVLTGEAVNVTYGSGYFVGMEYLDQVTLAPGLVITNQSIGDALSFDDFRGVDGIVGIGPVDITRGRLSPDRNATIPTVMDNLVSQGLIERQVLGVYFAPSTNYSDTSGYSILLYIYDQLELPDGALTYGGIDPRLYEGNITFVPVTETHPASDYWGINITASTYGNHTIIPASTAGIVDTGTTLILLANESFSAYLDAIPGAHLDKDTGLIEIPHESISSMQPLNFVIADRVFTLDVVAQLIPGWQNKAWGGVSGKYYGVVTTTGRIGGMGLDFILGQKFMERYYSIFDAEANCVGFAQTNNTFMTCQDYQV